MTLALPTRHIDSLNLDEQRLIVRRSRITDRTPAISVSIVLTIATFVVFCVSISVGDFPIPLSEMVAAIFGHGNESSDFIIHGCACRGPSPPYSSVPCSGSPEQSSNRWPGTRSPAPTSSGSPTGHRLQPSS